MVLGRREAVPNSRLLEEDLVALRSELADPKIVYKRHSWGESWWFQVSGIRALRVGLDEIMQLQK